MSSPSVAFSSQSLTPLYGLGSYGRTGPAVIISSPRTKLGSQGRIYAYMKTHGQGDAYKAQLVQNMGLQFMPRVNPWTYI